MNLQFIILLPLAVAAYFILTDEGVAAAFYYVNKLAFAKIKRYWWWLMNNPNNWITKYLIWRRSFKTARTLQKYFDERRTMDDRSS